MAAPHLLPTVDRYNPVARLLHWAVAVLVIVVLPAGFVIEYIKEDSKLIFYGIHESLGFLVLWLMLVRLAVRLFFPPPPPVPMPILFERTAAVVHGLLYVALIAQATLGFLATNAFGFPLKWFWLVEVWSPIGKNDELGRTLIGVHSVLGWTILVLVVLHLGGVVFHHVIRRDATLYRMI